MRLGDDAAREHSDTRPPCRLNRGRVALLRSGPGATLPRLALIGLCLGFFVVLLDATIVNVALGQVQYSLGGSLSGLQWVLGGYTVSFAALMLSAGSIGDRWGCRAAFLAGLAVFGVASAGCAVAPTLPVLVAARVLQGCGAALVTPCSLALIAHLFIEPGARARALGTWGGVSGIGLAAGPLVGGVLVDMAGWRAVFWVVVPFAAFAGLLVASTVPETARRADRRADLPGQVLLTFALVAATAALTLVSSVGWGAPLVLGLLGLAVLLSAVFLVTERRRTHPLIPEGMWRSRRFRAVLLFGGIFNFGLYGVLFCLALYLEQAGNRTASDTGLVIMPMTVAIAVTAALSGRVTHRFGPRAAMLAGMTAGLLGSLVMAASTSGAPWWVLVGGETLFGGVGLAMPAMTSVALGTAPPGNSGLAAAALNAARQAGGALGVATLGALLLDRAGQPTPRTALLVVAAGWATTSWLATRAAPSARSRTPRGR